jgi:hypothetical protein
MRDDIPYGLSDKELSMCDKLLDNGFSNITTEEHKMMSKDNVRDYLDWRRSSKEAGHKLTYKKKLDTILSIIEILPSNVKDFMEQNDKNEAVAIMRLVLSAIQLSNDMQGHKAAEKYVTTNISFDCSEINKELNNFRCKYKRSLEISIKDDIS